MIIYHCDGKDCEASAVNVQPAAWTQITPRRGAGEKKEVVGGTLLFCPSCWQRTALSFRPLEEEAR